MIKCEKCGREAEEVFRTLYGENICGHCYDDYLMTDEGKPEYLFGIVTGREKLTDYDSDFLGHVATCWKKYRDQLIFNEAELRILESTAIGMGLL